MYNRCESGQHKTETTIKIVNFIVGKVPHEGREYRVIFDLSFLVKVVGWDLQFVNETTKEILPAEALEQVGTVMPRIIEALASALLSEDPTNFNKLYIKYGFWRMICAVGEEWNFGYVLKNHSEAPN